MNPNGNTPRIGFLRAISSLWFGAVILVLILVAMACGTIYESMHGTEHALAVFYTARWFQWLLALLGVSIVATLISRLRSSRSRIGFSVTHGSILLIIGGAMVTRLFGVDGQLALMEGEATDQLRLSGREQLTLSNRASGASSSVDLNSSVFGGLQAADQPKGATLALEQLQVHVDRYLPDSITSTTVLNDGPALKAAVEVTLSGAGSDDPVWIFEGEPRSIGRIAATLTPLSDRNQLEQKLQSDAATAGASVGVLKLSVADRGFEFPVEACMAQAVPLGESGYTVRVLDYFPHAMVAEGGLTNASPKPVNPAIRAEIVGPSGAQTKVAFARFPDFASSHGSDGIDVKLMFVASAAPSASTPIEVMALPDGEMHARFSAGGEPVSRMLRAGEPVDTPWPGVTFTVRRKFDHARVTQELVQPPEIRKSRMPAVLLRANGDAGTAVWVAKNQPRSMTIGGTPYVVLYSDQNDPLGFRVTLNKFTVGYYPGGRRPRSFESQITISNPASGDVQNRIISMNHPTSYGGYTLYQSSYELSGERALSVLSVARDPGQPIVFAGYIGLLAGMCWALVARLRARTAQGSADSAAKRNGSRPMPLFRPEDRCLTRLPGVPGNKASDIRTQAAHSASRGSSSVHLGAAVLALLVGQSVMAKELPASLDLDAVRGICVQHDGRYMPLDTLARDMVESVTGKASFENHDAVLWLLAWVFEPPVWQNEPLIRIGNSELRREIGLAADKNTFSYNELTSHQRLLSLIGDLSRMDSGRKMDPLESKVSGIHNQLTQLQTVFRGQSIRVIPDPADPLGAWKPPGAVENAGLNAAWEAVRKAFVADDAAAFATASQQLAQTTASLPAAFRPAPPSLATELRYNRLAPFSTAWRIMVAGTAVAALAMIVRRRWFDAMAFAALVAGFGMLTFGLSLRWQIAGRIPASNMFESLLFLSWGVGAFAILSIPLFRQRLVPFTASAMSSLALVLADVLPVDSFVRPIAPVLLDTVWMSIHVPIIMVSYSVLLLAVLIAHIQLFAMAAAPKRAAFAESIDVLHYWYVQVGSILLTAGIITGSMWAASSWGRYWGWDPKEVWSLVALLGYLTILHVRIDHERMPRWLYGLVAVLVLGMLAVIVPKLAPLTAGRVLALVGAVAGMGFMVLARGYFATAAKSIICFWLIVMTYVGVNFVLGVGLHSYGFGTGAVARYMFLLGGADLGIVVLCMTIYLLRSRTNRVRLEPNLSLETA